MNVAFFGTSDRSAPILDILHKEKATRLLLCVTKDDRKIGRHQVVKPTGVKKWAMENGVHFVTVDSMNPENTRKICDGLLDKKIDLVVIADFSFIIPQEILEVPKHGFVNIHFSLLPKYRGASPVQFAILNGDEKTGITYHLVEKTMDTGPILHQIEYKLKGDETAGKLYGVLFEIAAKNLSKVLKTYISGEIKPKSQTHSDATYTYSPTHPKTTFIFKEDALIDWSRPAAETERMIRAFHPWPISWTTLGSLEASFRQASLGRVGSTSVFKLKGGKNPTLRVKVLSAGIKNEKLLIKRLVVEGGKEIGWEDFINGYFTSS